MSLFGRDSQKEQQEPDEYDFDFSVLWQDEEQSNLLQYLPHVVEIVLLIWAIIKIK